MNINYINSVELINNGKNYKLTTTENIVLFVPLDEANTDYQAIQKWIAEGGIVIDNAPSGTEAEGGEVIDNPRSDNPPTE